MNAVVEAYLEDPDTDAYLFADDHSLDLGAAVTGHAWASHVTSNPKSSPALKRSAVRTAILLPRAQKG